MIKILVIDDEPQIRRFLRISLASQGYSVIEASDGEEGISLAATESPHIIVLDLGLPDKDGKEVLKEIRQFCVVPVIVLSVRSSEIEKVAVLDIGANDYVVKPFGIKEFLARIRSLLRMVSDISQAPLSYDDGYLKVDVSKRLITIDGKQVHLSKKEYELLIKLMMHAGRIVTQQQLLKEIWGASHTEDTHYLRIFIAKLRNKLGDNSAEPRYIETEPGVGYRFLGDQPDSR